MDCVSRQITQNFVDKYLEDRELKILDLGSLDITGNQNKCFRNPKWKLICADIMEGKNVDVVLKKPYEWNEFADSSFDVVVSNQTFEHIEFPWLTIKEIARILKSGGLGCLVAPSAGYMHRYPVDCWRIMPDGFIALAKWAGLEVIKTYQDKTPENMWKQSVLIFRK
jgi:SAM-dependent methyltransferase